MGDFSHIDLHDQGELGAPSVPASTRPDPATDSELRAALGLPSGLSRAVMLRTEALMLRGINEALDRHTSYVLRVTPPELRGTFGRYAYIDPLMGVVVRRSRLSDTLTEEYARALRTRLAFELPDPYTYN